MDKLKIDVQRLGDEELEVRAELSEAWLRRQLEDLLHEEQGGSGEVELRVQKMSEDKVQVQGHIRARFATPCARCLEPAEIVVDEPYFMVFEVVDEPEGMPAELELTEADLSWEPFDGREIDLASQVREQLVLAVPMRPICREQCPGIEHAGRQEAQQDEDAVDPRLKVLAKLKPTR